MEMPRAIAIRRTALRWLRVWGWDDSGMARKGSEDEDRTTAVAHAGPGRGGGRLLRPARGRRGETPARPPPPPARRARRDRRAHARPDGRHGREGGIGRELLHLAFPSVPEVGTPFNDNQRIG